MNKKLLQKHISECTGKVVVLKDISNLQTGLHSRTDRNDLSALVARLKAIEGVLSISNVLLQIVQWNL